ncbi:MAG: spermidine/putrescine ABC transporter substrate-binding protein [Actinobacteria bacterium ATB1]|nr:spermidine/putrescine ABC transporter substrate-binding protein [Actinobacteria bacterium ATB1]
MTRLERRTKHIDPRRTPRYIAKSVTRRGFLGASLAVGGLAAVSPLVAACGGDSDEESSGGDTGSAGGEDILRISNWPLYIDDKTVGEFEEASGLTVEYTEDINDNEEYFAKIKEPLTRDQDIGADMFIVTDFLVSRLINLGWLEKLDDSKIPNKANLVQPLFDVGYDPERVYSLPWFSGFTAIAYNIELTGEEITSTSALFDPKYKGKVTMLSDLRDGLGQIILLDGATTEEVTEEDVQRAADRVQAAKDAGQIRRFTGNDYADDLAQGNVAIAQAYSGDVAQLQLDNPNLRFVVPQEGGIIFSDNMVIPTTTKNADGAFEWMDYVYDPAHNAQITAEVQFISPVREVAAELEKLDPELAANPLVVPTEEMLALGHEWRPLTDEEEVTYSEIYANVTAS